MCVAVVSGRAKQLTRASQRRKHGQCRRLHPQVALSLEPRTFPLLFHFLKDERADQSCRSRRATMVPRFSRTRIRTLLARSRSFKRGTRRWTRTLSSTFSTGFVAFPPCTCAARSSSLAEQELDSAERYEVRAFLEWRGWTALIGLGRWNLVNDRGNNPGAPMPWNRRMLVRPFRANLSSSPPPPSTPSLLAPRQLYRSFPT